MEKIVKHDKVISIVNRKLCKMHKKRWTMDLIYTNEACTGCNKCVRACPVLTANVATEAGKVMVDSEKCIVWRRYYDVGIFEIYYGT